MNFVRCEKCYCDHVETGPYFSEVQTKIYRGEIL